MVKSKVYTIIVCSISVCLLFFSQQSVFSHEGEHEEVEAFSGGNQSEIDELNEKIQQKKDRVAELEKSIAAYKEKITQKQLEARSLTNQVVLFDNYLARTQLEINETEEKIDTLELEIQSLALAIEDKEQTIMRQQDMMGELLRTIHIQDNKDYIEIAANYDNFSEFYNQKQYVKTVESQLGNNARALRLLKEELEKKQEQQEERQQSYEDLKKNLEQQQKDLQEQAFAKEQLLVQTRSEEMVFQTLIAQQKKQYQQIENEISGIEKEIRRQLEQQDKLDDLESSSGDLVLSWPTQSRYITARFRDPDYPYRHVFEHSAIDIRAAQGTPLKAAASGYVARARYCKEASCYAYVLLIHSGGISTLYGHMSSITVQEGQFVARGDVIGASGAQPGTVGAGPFTTGPHLHFEVRKNGIPVNPLLFLIKDY